MSELAKRIVVTRGKDNPGQIEIDGEEFPWLVGEGITVELDSGAYPCIAIRIPAEQVYAADARFGDDQPE